MPMAAQPAVATAVAMPMQGQPAVATVRSDIAFTPPSSLLHFHPCFFFFSPAEPSLPPLVFTRAPGSCRPSSPSQSVDAVDIIVPPYLHKELVIKAAEAKKHVYVTHSLRG